MAVQGLSDAVSQLSGVVSPHGHSANLLRSVIKLFKLGRLTHSSWNFFCLCICHPRIILARTGERTKVFQEALADLKMVNFSLVNQIRPDFNLADLILELAFLFFCPNTTQCLKYLGVSNTKIF